MEIKETLKLRDILPEHPVDCICERGADPYGEDMLLGICKWDGENLIPLDGDSYSLDAEVLKYEYDENNNLSYWTPTTWYGHGETPSLEKIAEILKDAEN